MSGDRFEAIRLQPTERVTVVLASEYDALLKAREDLQDRYDLLRAQWAVEELHDEHCEQEGGDPYCGCRARSRRQSARSSE